MVTDSPYDATDYALRPAAGLVAGLLGAGVMLLPLALSGTQGSGVLHDVLISAGDGGNRVLRLTGAAPAPVVSGSAVHAALGAMLGLLYAVCQVRRPVSGLIAVGVSYGFTIWIFSGLVASALGHDVWGTVRSWPWLVACVTYGVSLALAAAWSQAQHKAMAVVPLD